MRLLLIFGVTLCMWTIFAQQQPAIAPLSYTAFLDPSDVSARFNCTGEGVAVWRVDGQAASSTEITSRGISTETNDDGGNFTSQIIIPATVENNNTEVQCWAVSDIVVLSEVVTFIIQGPLAPPPNLTIVDADACSIYKLVWSAPFTLDVSGVDPDISTYTICSNITGYYTCSNTSGSGVMEHVFRRPFRYVEFRVSAVNGAGQGSESSVVYKPDNISTNVIFENATIPSVNVSFQVNCSKSYNIVIVGSNNESVSSHPAMPDVDGNVMVTVDSGLESNERYNFTVTENITEGMKGNPSVSFTTFDVQDADTVSGAGEINVTCRFAVGSEGRGCHVLIVNSTTDEEVMRENITRGNSIMDGAPMPMNATGELSGLEMGMYFVVLYDIEYDYSIDLNEVALNKSAEITVAAPIIATTVKFTDASSTTDDGPTVVNSNAIPTSTLVVPATTPVEPAGAGSSTVGIAVGVLLSAVAVLMVTVLILVLVLILKHKRKLKHSPINTVSYSTTQNSAGSNAGRYTDMPLKTGPEDDYLNSINDFIGAPLPHPPSYEAVNAVSQQTTSTGVSLEPLYANTGTPTGTGTRQEPQYANTGMGQEEPQYANAGVEKQQDPVYANAKEVLPEKKQEKKPEVQYAELGPMASNMPAAPPPMETEVQYSTVQGQPKRQAPPPLLHSCEVGNIAGVRQLIAAEAGGMDGRTLNSKNTEDGLTPLHVAALHGHLEIVDLLLQQPQAKPDIRDKKRCTPLHLACKEGHLEVVKVLVSKGASLEMEDYPNKWTPLHHASANVHTQVVRYLIQAGCCVDHQDFEQCTPLFGACKEGHLEVVKCLVVEGKANVHHRDKDKHTPLHAASARGHIGVVMFLVNEAGADVLSRDNKSRTPWEYATINVHSEVTNFLQETMEKKHREATAEIKAPTQPPKEKSEKRPSVVSASGIGLDTLPSLPPHALAPPMLPPKGEKRTSAPLVSPPPPPTARIPMSPVTGATAIDQHVETMSLPGSVPDHDDSCDIDALNVSMTSHSTPATRSPSRFEMGVVQPQGEGLVMENIDCSNTSELVFAGSRRSIVNSESETRNVDDVVVSTMRRTEAREPPKRGSNDDSFQVIRSGGSALIASNYELPAVEHTGFQNLSETEKQLGIFSYIFSNIWKENLSALTNTLSKLIRTDVLGAYYKLF